MRVDHLCTHFFACDEPEFDVKCKCLHKNVTLKQAHVGLDLLTLASGYLNDGKRTINADQRPYGTTT